MTVIRPEQRDIQSSALQPRTARLLPAEAPVNTSERPPYHPPTLNEISARAVVAEAENAGNPLFQEARKYALDSIGLLRNAVESGGLTQEVADSLAATIEASLVVSSETDGLTGLLRREAFTTRFEEAIELAARGSRPISVAIGDIDDFKKINDIYGHFGGDAILFAYGSIINDKLRRYDQAGRWGGEEIVIVMPDTDEETAFKVIERLRGVLPDTVREFTGAIRDDLKATNVTSSWGVTQLTAEELKQALTPGPLNRKFMGLIVNQSIERADEALYVAKRLRGKNSTVKSSELSPQEKQESQVARQKRNG